MTVRDVDIGGQRLDTWTWHRDGDPLWVSVRPNLRRIHVLAGDILAALGERRDVAGKGRNESEDVRLAVAWLAAHDVRDLVVLEAQRLHPHIIRSLTKLASAAGVDLWLLHRPPITDTVYRAISRHTHATEALTSVPTPVARGEDDPIIVSALPEVPLNDMHTFVAAVHETLAPNDAALVVAEFSASAFAMIDRINARGDAARAVVDGIAHLLRQAPCDAFLISHIRGVQVAAWHNDLHVSVDLTQLPNSQERPRVSTQAAGSHLLAYRQPHRAVAWYLAGYNGGLNDMSALPLHAGDPTGSPSRLRWVSSMSTRRSRPRSGLNALFASVQEHQLAKLFCRSLRRRSATRFGPRSAISAWPRTADSPNATTSVLTPG